MKLKMPQSAVSLWRYESALHFEKYAKSIKSHTNADIANMKISMWAKLKVLSLNYCRRIIISLYFWGLDTNTAVYKRK